MSKFPICEALGIRNLAQVPHGDMTSLSEVEAAISKRAKVGYGFGSEKAGSFTYSDEQDLNDHGFAQKCLILNVEDTNAETVESMAMHINKMMELAEGRVPVKIEDFVAEVKKLTKKVLRE